MDDVTPPADAGHRTLDLLGDAVDAEPEWDALEEQQALAAVERSLFSRAPQPIRVSRYLLTRALGKGGAGVVYEAYDAELTRRVAVKVLRSGRRDQHSAARARARFVREAQSIAQLSHPNVIAVHDVGTVAAGELGEGIAGAASDAEGVFIVMELVDGQDLADWLEAKPRPWREIVDVFVRAGQGVEAAHAAGIVHRDFKPGNVLVGRDGAIKVVDFGLALTRGDRGGSGHAASDSDSDAQEPAPPLDKLTRTGTLLGTPPYMAPEQHRGEPADAQADQFAFCASLYRALYGRHAFAGRTLEALFAAKVEEAIAEPPPNSDVPPWIHRAVVGGLASDPGARHPSMSALLRALRADPVRRARRIAARGAVVVGAAALAYTGWLATRPGRVVVRASADGVPLLEARVTLDNEELVDGQGSVTPGLYRVMVTAPDYEVAQAVVEVARGRVHEVELELRHETARLALEIEPSGAHVFIDGVDHGTRPQGFEVDTGPHEVLVRQFGYVDQRIDWNAGVGQTQRQFVALRKALAWSRPATGVFLAGRWLGDINGDGQDDLVQRRFTRLTAYDPWSDRERWRIELGPHPFFRLCDVGGDGVLDVLTVRSLDDGYDVLVYDAASQQRPLPPLWTVTLSGVMVDAQPELACLPGTAAGAYDVLVSGAGGLVARLDGRTGARHWSTRVPGPIVTVLAIDASGDDPGLVAIAPDTVTRLDSEGTQRWSTVGQIAARAGDGVLDAKWLEAVAEARRFEPSWVVSAAADTEPGDDLLVHVSDGVGWALQSIAGASGAVRWKRPVAAVARLRPNHELGDVDGDGAIDVVVRLPVEAPTIALVDGVTGQSRWTRTIPHRTATQLIVGPRHAPVVVERRGSTLTTVDAHAGTTLATVDAPAKITAPLTVADFDGDTRPDFVTGSSDGIVRVYDPQLRPIATVPVGVPISEISATHDANHDGFGDLLLQARGPAVLVGPKIRWERRPLDTIRATPLIDDFDADGAPEIALVGTLGTQKRLQILDARSGRIEAWSEAGDTPDLIRAPVARRGPGRVELLTVGSGLSRFDGADATLIDRYRTGPAYASPTLADVDDDGAQEVVMVTWGPGVVHVLDAQTLALKWSHEFGPMGSFGAPYVGDVDHDGVNEIVVAGLDGRVVCIDATGQPQWVTATGGRLNFTPTVADLGGDGSWEVVVAPQVDDDPLVVLRGSDGQIVQRWPHRGSRRAQPLAHDVDGDGNPEIISSTHRHGLVGMAGDGAERWRYGFGDVDGLQPQASGSPIIADLDGDGQVEVLAGFDYGSLVVVDAATGVLRWRFKSGREEIEASPAVADVDGDGQLEVFVAGHDRRLTCLDHGPIAR